MLTLHLFKAGDLAGTVTAAQSANTARGVQEIGRQVLQPATSLTFGGRGTVSAGLQTTLERGATIYKESCSVCHGPDGRGTPIQGAAGATLAPALISSNRVLGHRDYVIKSILHGLTGPLDGRTYGVMAPMGTNTDEWIASVSSYIRSGFGINNWLITPADVAGVRAANAARTSPWTFEELHATLPRPLVADATWKVTASHNASAAGGGLNISGWSTNAPQEAGMWFQIELPAMTRLTEIEFESPVPQGAGSAGSPAAGTYPRSYRVQISADGHTWSAPVVEGQGSRSPTIISFPPTLGRFIRITLTSSAPEAPAWAIRNVRLFEAR